MEWLEDENGNRCSVEYWGSPEKAQAALDSLVDCDGCVNCEGCVRCEDCVNCVRCEDCDGCVRCKDCDGCVNCEGCVRCEDCDGCVRCKDCVNCVKTRAINVDIAPKIENIHQKVLDAVTSSPDALDMKAWHTCETTHCRAGWVVHLAGKEGYDLEKKLGSTAFAAMLIYKASSPHRVRLSRFFESNKKAMEDIKRMAELEKAGG